MSDNVDNEANSGEPQSSPGPHPSMLGAAFSKLVSGSIGDVVVLMSRSAAERHYTLADIEWLILPPVMLGQFYVAEAQDEANGFRAPIALITRAKVSPEVDARLTASAGQPIQLQPQDWNSGDIFWLVDVVGNAAALTDALALLLDSQVKNYAIKFVARSDAGAVFVTTLQDVIASWRPVS